MQAGRLAIVLLVAAVAAIAIFVMLRPKHAPVSVAAAPPPVQKPMARVVVAKQDLPIGHRIAREDLSWQQWPLDAINPAFITDGAAPPPVVVKAKDGKAAPADKSKSSVASLIPNLSGGGAMDQLSGAVVRVPIVSGEPIVEAKIVRSGEGGFMAAVLQPGMQAMAVAVTADTGAGGFIQPGDRVDVLQSRHVDKVGPGAGGADVQSHVVLRNVRVLAIDQQNQAPKDNKAMVGSTATVEVASADAPILARAKTQGDLMLTLRSYADAGAPSGRVATETVSQQVKVYRAGQLSEVTVRQ